MASLTERLRVTALIVLVSMGVGAAVIVLGSQVPLIAPLGVAIILLGWFVLAPLYLLWLSRPSREAPESDNSVEERSLPEDPLARLKQRYADGDISEEEFERRLDTLLELEDLDLERHVGRAGSGHRSTEHELEFE